MYARSIKFTTSEENQEILDIEEIKNILKDMLKAKDDIEYQKLRENGISANVDIFTSETRIKINNTTYNDLIDNTLYSTNNIVKIYSIKSELPATGVIVFTMRGE